MRRMTKYIKPGSVSFLMNVRKRALAEVYRRGALISENFAYVSTLHLFITQGSKCHKNNFQRSTSKLRHKRLVLSSLHELHVKNMLRRKNIRLFHVYVYARLRIQRYSHGVVLLFPLLIIPCVLGNVQVVSLVAQCM